MFCHHLDNEKYSMAANKMSQTTEHKHGYFNVGTLLNNQSDVSSWSSQEVNVSQSQGQFIFLDHLEVIQKSFRENWKGSLY